MLRLVDSEKVETTVRRIENRIQSAVPQTERVLLHIEVRTSNHLRYAVPLEDITGTVSEHFGEAPYFGLVTLQRSSGAVEKQDVRANPFHSAKKAKGIRVAERLVAERVDRVFVPKNLEGKGPAFVFSEAGIEVQLTKQRTLAEIMAAQQGNGN